MLQIVKFHSQARLGHSQRFRQQRFEVPNPLDAPESVESLVGEPQPVIEDKSDLVDELCGWHSGNADVGDFGNADPGPVEAASDHLAFINANIPVGGLFTGSTGIKTSDQAAVYGGTAGQAYDSCYHLACDTYNNVNLEVLDLNADAIAYAVLEYAMQ